MATGQQTDSGVGPATAEYFGSPRRIPEIRSRQFLSVLAIEHMREPLIEARVVSDLIEEAKKLGWSSQELSAAQVEVEYRLHPPFGGVR
jgi:hypothetical protein